MVQDLPSFLSDGSDAPLVKNAPEAVAERRSLSEANGLHFERGAYHPVTGTASKGRMNTAAVTLSIDLIVSMIRYGSLRLDALSPSLRARIEAFEAGQKEEGEAEHDETGEGYQGES